MNSFRASYGLGVAPLCSQWAYECVSIKIYRCPGSKIAEPILKQTMFFYSWYFKFLNIMKLHSVLVYGNSFFFSVYNFKSVHLWLLYKFSRPAYINTTDKCGKQWASISSAVSRVCPSWGPSPWCVDAVFSLCPRNGVPLHLYAQIPFSFRIPSALSVTVFLNHPTMKTNYLQIQSHPEVWRTRMSRYEFWGGHNTAPTVTEILESFTRPYYWSACFLFLVFSHH